MVEDNEVKRKADLPEFDADYLPSNPQNRKAAEARDLVYDEVKRAYVDVDGCKIRDRFGQRY